MATQEILDLKAMLQQVLSIVETYKDHITILTRSISDLKEANVKQVRLIAEIQTHNKETRGQLYNLASCYKELDRNLSPGKSVVHDAIDEIEEKLKTYADAARLSHIEFVQAKEEEQRMGEEEKKNQQARINNCKLSGLAETERENTKEVVVTFLHSQLKVHEPQVLQAYRIGKPNEGVSRPILVKLAGAQEKAKIIANRFMLKGLKIWIDDDLTPTQWQARKLELEKVRKAQGEGWIAYLRDGQAIITNKKKDALK